jgi:hypothetical protein
MLTDTGRRRSGAGELCGSRVHDLKPGAHDDGYHERLRAVQRDARSSTVRTAAQVDGGVTFEANQGLCLLPYRGHTPCARGTRCDLVCRGRGVGERSSAAAAHLLVEDRRSLRCQRHSDPLRDQSCCFREPRATRHVRPLPIRKQCPCPSIVRRLDRRSRRHRSRARKYATCRFRDSHRPRSSTWRACTDRPFIWHTGRAPASSCAGS